MCLNSVLVKDPRRMKPLLVVLFHFREGVVGFVQTSRRYFNRYWCSQRWGGSYEGPETIVWSPTYTRCRWWLSERPDHLARRLCEDGECFVVKQHGSTSITTWKTTSTVSPVKKKLSPFLNGWDIYKQTLGLISVDLLPVRQVCLDSWTHLKVLWM